LSVPIIKLESKLKIDITKIKINRKGTDFNLNIINNLSYFLETHPL